MCGIAGFSGRFEADLLSRMSGSIAHRGPDDHGDWIAPEGGVGLAHRRLSIIDLSPRGRQPMWDATRAAVISFNGEIYNYRELRRELEASGFAFRSDSDTEVLLNLWLRDGSAMLPKLNGIFAFALYDVRSRSLFLARDGLGVKPLYVAETPRGVLFASELKALLHEPSLDRGLDPEAVYAHLLYLWSPSPTTMLRSVRKLEPGFAMTVREGRVEKRWRWYDLPYDQPIDPVSESVAIDQVKASVARAVERQMVADVPVGAFLSGGLDSSSVVAFARAGLEGRRLQCFTMEFPADLEAQEAGIGDDLAYAKRVATHLGVDLHSVRADASMVGELERVLYHLDEPQPDLAAINTLLICRLAREHGIKVLLSGAGGDDIFTGYRRHVALQQERWWAWLPAPARGLLARGAAALPHRGELARRVSKAFWYADRGAADRLASYFYWIPPEALDGVLAPGVRSALPAGVAGAPLRRALEALPPHVAPLNRMLYLEGKFFLADHNLNYVDKTSMSTGVEVRVPLLDPDLVALACRLPVGLKQRGAEGKWIFKRAMESVLPHDVIYRSKRGFGVPLRYWLRNQLRPVVEDVLSEASLVRRGLFDPAGVRALVEADRAQRFDAAYTILGLICIELWCRMFLDPAVPSPPAAG